MYICEHSLSPYYLLTLREACPGPSLSPSETRELQRCQPWASLQAVLGVRVSQVASRGELCNHNHRCVALCVCVWVCVCVCACLCLLACVQKCLLACVCECVCVYFQTYVRPSALAWMRAYVCPCMHPCSVHPCVRACVCGCKWIISEVFS